MYSLDKAVWTEKDFDKIIPGVANIHAMCFQQNRNHFTGDLVLDIDYIFKAVEPLPPNEHSSYWISPCTLIFHETIEFKMDYDTTQYSFGLLDVEEVVINRVNINEAHVYNIAIELWGGSICFNCNGFTQIVRRAPVCVPKIELSIEERGGTSFDIVPFIK